MSGKTQKRLRCSKRKESGEYYLCHSFVGFDLTNLKGTIS